MSDLVGNPEDRFSHNEARISCAAGKPLRGFRPGSDTNLGVWPQEMARSLKYWKQRDCSIYVAKMNVLISCAVTAQLILAFVFAYAKSRFSHGRAPICFDIFSSPEPKAHW